MELEPGTVFAGRYEVVSLLGQGGMGAVYRAHDRTLGETIALKIVRSETGDLHDIAQRFLSEIKLARRVGHRNVCRIFEYGDDHGVQFIAMELIEGTDLKTLVRSRGLLATQQAFDVALQAAAGLEAIHELGIVHRDLKTANLMLDSRGVVKVMDFGIAKRFEGEGLTATGQVVGTPEYMSPEQAQGEPVDGRSDIYSFGVVLFELFTGELPFKGDTPVATILKHIQQPPPLDAPRARPLPEPVVQLLRTALAKKPEARFASAAALLAALRSAQAAVTVVPQPTLTQPAITTPLKTDGRSVPAAQTASARPVPRRPTQATTIVLIGGALGVFAVAILASIAFVYRVGSAPATAPPPASTPQVAPGSPVRGPSVTSQAPPSGGTAPNSINVRPTVVKELMAGLRSDDRNVARGAMKDLGDLGPAAAEAVPALGDVFLHIPASDGDTLQLSAQALAKMGPAAMPPLLEGLDDANDRRRALAAWALGEIGPAAGDAIPRISTLFFKRRDRTVVGAAAEALHKIGPASVPALIEALGSQDPDVRRDAASALGELGAASHDAVPALVSILKETNRPGYEHEQARLACAWALGEIGAAAEVAIPDIADAIRRHGSGVRDKGVRALGGIGTKAVPAVASFALEPHFELQYPAFQVLGQWGPAAAEAVPAMIQALKSGDSYQRREACNVLGAIGPAAKAALPTLTAALNDEDYSVQLAAKQALQRIGGKE